MAGPLKAMQHHTQAEKHGAVVKEVFRCIGQGGQSHSHALNAVGCPFDPAPGCIVEIERAGWQVVSVERFRLDERRIGTGMTHDFAALFSDSPREAVEKHTFGQNPCLDAGIPGIVSRIANGKAHLHTIAGPLMTGGFNGADHPIAFGGRAHLFTRQDKAVPVCIGRAFRSNFEGIIGRAIIVDDLETEFEFTLGRGGRRFEQAYEGGCVGNNVD